MDGWTPSFGVMRGWVAGLAACLAAAACTPAGDAGPEPVERSLGWFATLEARDLAAQCRPGADRLRLIYNGSYDEQIRWYELTPDGTLSALVRGRPNLLVIDLRDPLGAWRGTERRRPLTADERARLFDAVAAALVAAAPPGTRLESHNPYWIAALCRDGGFRYAAFDLIRGGGVQPPFAAAVMALDPTGIPLAPAATVAYSPPRADATPGFIITVDRTGLVPMDSPFGTTAP